MKKAILINMRPEWVQKVLNGEKTLECIKDLPKDYIGWIYIYCQKEKPKLYSTKSNLNSIKILDYPLYDCVPINGKVVARFWCENAKKIDFSSLYWACHNDPEPTEELNKLSYSNINFYKKACHILAKIIGSSDLTMFVVDILNLEIFDDPKSLTEMKMHAPYINWKFVDEDIMEKQLNLNRRITC